jgi:hypothetical protein
MIWCPNLIKKVLSNEVLHLHPSTFSGAFDGAMLALSTQPLSEGTDLDFTTDVIVPTYPGYADQAIVWGEIERNVNGNYAVNGPLLTFQSAGSTEGTTIVAVAIYTVGTPNNVIAVENLDSPVTLGDDLDAFNYVPQLAIGLSDGGVGTVVD